MSDEPKSAKGSGIAAVAVLGLVLWAIFGRVDDWASVAFAQAQLAAMLVAVIDVGLLAAALCLAPALSKALHRMTGR